MAKQISRSKKIAQKTIFAAFNILKKAGGSLRAKEVVDKIRETVEFDEYETHRYEKTGYIRWESVFYFYTIDCMKAGFLRKHKGVWSLTDEGEKAIKLGEEKLLETATAKYWEWDAKRKKSNDDVDEVIEEDVSQQQQALLEQYQQQALDGLRDYIVSKGPYDFQDMVAILLEAMGYFISFVSPQGKDGGIDILAYTDPLGVKLPRIIVQVKHRPDSSISSDDIQRLAGTMKRPSDVGIFVTSGTFSKPAIMEARSSDKHIELIDFDRFIELWQEHYPKMSDEQKNIMPLQPIYFLGSNE
ncbi:MAG TPA: restriction endonuclease [Tenuifilaceae bacterium]|nr:restriction endonuclease [Tenuifilaceae bacterium]